MMRLSVLFLSVLAAVSATLEEPLLGFAEDVVLVSAAGSHYGNPASGCQPDEKSFRVQGIDGDLCTPPCTSAGKCPADVPTGVTAHPLCALQTPEGTQYCVLLCQPSDLDESATGMCGDAKCRAIKGQPGVGICTYDLADDNEEVLGAGAW
jgi:hypothetical protein